jgi:hypothetical protein
MMTLTQSKTSTDVMELLRQGVPLTLLMDPHSDELYLAEGSAA